MKLHTLYTPYVLQKTLKFENASKWKNSLSTFKYHPQSLTTLQVLEVFIRLLSFQMFTSVVIVKRRLVLRDGEKRERISKAIYGQS